MFLVFEGFQFQNSVAVLLFSIKQTTPDVNNCQYFINGWVNFINGQFICDTEYFNTSLEKCRLI